MSERSLATVRRIDGINPIVGADAIELAIIGGWQVVVKKNEFKSGDLGIYLEIDSWVPHALAPFLSKGNHPRIYNDVEGERLKTIKLRGELSQGLLLPLYSNSNLEISYEEGQDLTEELGIQKWEKAIHPSLAGLAKGNFPHFIRKSDQERAQNLVNKIFSEHKDKIYEVTVKMDGSSITAYHYDGEVGVCSRNINLKIEDNDDNAFVQTATNSGLINALQQLGMNVAVQGELVGGNIQGNTEKIPTELGYQIYIYNVFDIERQQYLTPQERALFVDNLIYVAPELNHVPIHGFGTLSNFGVENISDLLEIADGKGLYTDKREGLVFKSLDDGFSFKVISNKWLLKNE